MNDKELLLRRKQALENMKINIQRHIKVIDDRIKKVDLEIAEKEK